jgi:hypothetical protein
MCCVTHSIFLIDPIVVWLATAPYSSDNYCEGSSGRITSLTALHLAALSCNAPAVEFLLVNGAQQQRVAREGKRCFLQHDTYARRLLNSECFIVHSSL